MCAEIENEFTKGKYRLADMKMNEIKRKFWPKVGMLKDANGIVLNEPEKKKMEGIHRNFTRTMQQQMRQ